MSRLSALLLALPVASAVSCVGLGCSLLGEFHWRSSENEEAISLRLNITVEEADFAQGVLTHNGVTEQVMASLAFARGGKEALLKWLGPESTTTAGTWNALFLGSSVDHLWLHGSSGIMVELVRAPLVEEPKANATAKAKNASSSTTVTYSPLEGRSAATGELLGVSAGQLHRFRSLSRDACLVASTDEAPHFGPCAAEEALWEVAKGKSGAVRALKHYQSGLCLQRRCYTDNAAPLRLGKCGQCGTGRWVLDSGNLAAQSLTGDRLFCLGRRPPPPPPSPAKAATKPSAAPAGNATADGSDTTNATAAAAEEAADTAGVEPEDDDESATSTLAYSSVCGPLAEPIAREAARMTLVLPSTSADTLLDDWLSLVASSQREVGAR